MDSCVREKEERIRKPLTAKGAKKGRKGREEKPYALSGLRFDHFTAANAGRAYSHALGSGAHTGVDGTQIDVPAPLGNVVGVADAVS